MQVHDSRINDDRRSEVGHSCVVGFIQLSFDIPCGRHLVAKPFGWAAVVQKVDPDCNTVDGFVWPIVGPHPALLNQMFNDVTCAGGGAV